MLAAVVLRSKLDGRCTMHFVWEFCNGGRSELNNEEYLPFVFDGKVLLVMPCSCFLVRKQFQSSAVLFTASENRPDDRRPLRPLT